MKIKRIINLEPRKDQMYAEMIDMVFEGVELTPEAQLNIPYILSNLEIVVEIDTETGTAEVLECDGRRVI